MTQSAFVSGAQDHGGAPWPASRASCQRGAQRHQRSPGFQARESRIPASVSERSLPRGFGKLEKRGGHDSADRVATDVLSPVSQQPSRKNPVLGLIEQTSSRSPSTLQGVPGRPPPTITLSSLSIAVSACGVVDRLPSLVSRTCGFPTVLPLAEVARSQLVAALWAPWL